MVFHYFQNKLKQGLDTGLKHVQVKLLNMHVRVSARQPVR